MKAKKITQKLTLNKLTVANLASPDLSAIKGGLPDTVTCTCVTYACNSCTCSGNPNCPDY
ncbi:MAG: class I lanthipeptide [Acidobacteria bacterium]|jgi:natural product precursor|nr:class I lanthipeptide [Acidobacteriota bacterium]